MKTTSSRKKKNYFIAGIILIIGAFMLLNFHTSTYKMAKATYRYFLYASARENYEKYCAGCHGDQLDKFVDRKWVYGNSWNEVFYSIKNGYINDGMPSYDTTFTDKEINELVDFILNGIEEFESRKLEEGHLLEGIIKSKDLAFHLEEVVSNQKIPWGLAFLQNKDMLNTERSGKLYRLAKNKQLHEI
jgi:hypothetical protein